MRGLLSILILIILGCGVEPQESIENQPMAMAINCEFCNGGSTTLTANGTGGTLPYAYDWTGGSTGPNLVVSSSGTYEVTVTDNSGCTAVDQFIVTELAPIAVTISENNCVLSATISGGTGSGYTYLWSTGETTPTISVDMDIDYTLTITDSNGCVGTDIISVTGCDCNCEVVPQPPIFVCQGTNTTVTAQTTGCTGAVSYCWFPDPPFGCIGGTGQSLTFGCSCGSQPCPITSSVQIEVTDANGCSDVYNFVYTCNTCASCNITANVIGDNDICPGETNVLTATGSTNTTTTYSWTTSGGGSISGSTTSAQANATSAGTYCVTMTETQSGITCSDTDCFTIVVGTCGPNCNMTNTTNVNGCTVTALPVNGTGPYTYSWSSGATTSTWTATSNGTYTFTITDSQNCTTSGSVTVTNCNNCTLSSSITVSGCDLTANPIGGTAPYAYLWGGGQTTQTITNQVDGNYSVEITDAQNCTSIATVTLTGCNPCDCTLSMTFNQSTCELIPILSGSGCSNYGVIGVLDWNSDNGTCTGGNSTLGTAGSGGALLVTSDGDYSAIAAGANGCPSIQSQCINVSGCECNCTVAIAQNSTNPCKLNANVNQSCAPSVSYLWSNGSTNNNIIVDVIGVYEVTVTDGNACTATDQITVNNLPNPPTSGLFSIEADAFFNCPTTGVLNISSDIYGSFDLCDCNCGDQELELEYTHGVFNFTQQKWILLPTPIVDVFSKPPNACSNFVNNYTFDLCTAVSNGDIVAGDNISHEFLQMNTVTQISGQCTWGGLHTDGYADLITITQSDIDCCN